VKQLRQWNMLRFSEYEWKALIPFIGFCNHVKAGIEKIQEENKQEALSQLQRKGLPKKTASTQQSAALVPIPVITSFFKSVSSDILDLPDDRDAEALMLTNETCEPITTPPIVTRENIGEMIDICYGKMMAKGSLL
jgi:hypothetical protein